MSPSPIIRAVLALVLGGPGFLLAHPEHTPPPHWQAATDWPDRVIATLTDDPATSFSANWRTDASVGRTIAQIAVATPDARFDIHAETLEARTEQVALEHMPTTVGIRHSLENVGLGPTHYHSITFRGLEPDTLYAWRVQGGRGNWSEWYQTRTAPDDGPVEFVFFGDAQNGIRSHWSRVIRAAHQEAPRADFFLHAGDLVQKGDSDYNWAEWFEAGGFVHAMIPVVPVPGNHENVSVWPDGPSNGRIRVRTSLWRPHFKLPVERDLPEQLHESVYRVRYSDALEIFVIDSARNEFVEQAEWLDSALEASTARWTVVTMHHPYFAPEEMDRRARDAHRRTAFTPVIDHHDVDLVLTGHIHLYGRGTQLAPENAHTARTLNGQPRSVETVFITSFSGAKATNYPNDEEILEGIESEEPVMNDATLDRFGENTPLFQVIRINGDSLEYAAHTATGEQYDSFVLEKTEDGGKRLSEGEAAFGDTRFFSNSGEYREWTDLR